jgi:hypothetical protein
MIEIPGTLNKEIEDFIKDNCVKRDLSYMVV